MKKITIKIFIVFALAFLNSCNLLPENENDILQDSLEDQSDYVWDSSKITKIELKENGAIITGNGANSDKSIVTITSPGNFDISGTITEGQIIVRCSESGTVRLILNGCSVINTSTSPLFIDKASKTVVILNDNTINSFTDGTTYTETDEGQNAAVYSQSYLSFSGNGTLNVNGKFNDAITSKDGMVIKSGKFNITANDDGIRGKDYLIIHDGEFKINSTGDAIKSDNETDEGTGYITVKNGTYLISASGGDGISASNELKIISGTFSITTGGGSNFSTKLATSTKALKGLNLVTIEDGNYTINSRDDAIHSNGKVVINKGTFNISSTGDGIHADKFVTINEGSITISKSKEGIESNVNTVNGGNITVYSTDDCFNATAGQRTEANDGSYNNFNGGTIYVSSASGDALDSNGNMTQKGGNIVAIGPANQPNVALDYNGTFNVSGGNLIASGPNAGRMIQGFSNSSSQNSITLTSATANPASNLFHIKDSEGTEIVTLKSERTYYYIIFTSPLLKTGKSYSVYTGGSHSGILSKGIYSGGTYSGGTLKKTFTVNSGITTDTF